MVRVYLFHSDDQSSDPAEVNSQFFFVKCLLKRREMNEKEAAVIPHCNAEIISV